MVNKVNFIQLCTLCTKTWKELTADTAKDHFKISLMFSFKETIQFKIFLKLIYFSQKWKVELIVKLKNFNMDFL